MDDDDDNRNVYSTTSTEAVNVNQLDTVEFCLIMYSMIRNSYYKNNGNTILKTYLMCIIFVT